MRISLDQGVQVMAISAGVTVIAASFLMLRYAAKNMGLDSLGAYRALGLFRFLRVIVGYAVLIGAGVALLTYGFGMR